MTTEQLEIIEDARKITEETCRPFLALDVIEIQDRIDAQATVLSDCIQFAQKVGRGEHDCKEPLDGLYFAFTHYKDLVYELSLRCHEMRKG
jgi:hypothetical protein